MSIQGAEALSAHHEPIDPIGVPAADKVVAGWHVRLSAAERPIAPELAVQLPIRC
jgi:hypothetical protein